MQQVRARVADVRDRDVRALHDGGGQRRPHARLAETLARRADHLAVCGLDRACERLGVGAARRVIAHRLDRDRAGDLAGLVPAETIGHHEQRWLRENGVLVVGAHAADVGERRPALSAAAHHERSTTRRTAPMSMVSPTRSVVGTASR